MTGFEPRNTLPMPLVMYLVCIIITTQSLYRENSQHIIYVNQNYLELLLPQVMKCHFSTTWQLIAFAT